MSKQILFVLVLILSSICVNSMTVNTSLGQIKGNELFIAEKNHFVSEFLGVPYAKPPIGDLRFKPAHPIDNWNGVWNATHYRPSCMQIDETDVSEDCLFVNIYVPHNKFDDQKKHMKKSVMMWIYGGGFLTGTINDFNATYLSALGDVIVVAVNYRLTAFGFLYDGSSEAPGNQALTDSITALEFIHKNIEHFGGDPNSVTIFGQSAGSMTVSALMLVQNRNLFKRAIMQSGSVNSYYGSQPKESALIKAEKLAKHFNCFNNETEKIDTPCLRKVEATLIADYCDKNKINAQFFTPIYGDHLIPTNPSIALENGNFNKNVQLLFGFCKDEGAGMVASDFSIKDLQRDSPDSSMSISKAHLFIQLVFSALKISYASEVADFYIKGLTDKDGLALKHAVADAFGDYQLICPTIYFGSAVAKHGKAFAYQLAYSSRSGWTGVEHSDDLKYVFGTPLRFPNESTVEEKHLSLAMIDIWTYFAKTGNSPIVNEIDWLEAIDNNITDPSVRYMALNPKDYKFVENAYKQRCDIFWKTHLQAHPYEGLVFPLH